VGQSKPRRGDRIRSPLRGFDLGVPAGLGSRGSFASLSHPWLMSVGPLGPSSILARHVRTIDDDRPVAQIPRQVALPGFFLSDYHPPAHSPPEPAGEPFDVADRNPRPRTKRAPFGAPGEEVSIAARPHTRKPSPGSRGRSASHPPARQTRSRDPFSFVHGRPVRGPRERYALVAPHPHSRSLAWT
jgi:hypothetical protein